MNRRIYRNDNGFVRLKNIIKNRMKTDLKASFQPVSIFQSVCFEGSPYAATL